MKAQHPGKCHLCLRPIEPGEEITQGSSLRWVHSECASKAEEIGDFDPEDVSWEDPEP